MATFQAQLKGITSLNTTASTNPSLDNVSQFLLDGQHDVALRLMKSKPTDLHLISTVVTTITTPGTFDDAVESGIVSEVLINDGTDLQPAERIDPGHVKRAENPDSLFYRSKYNPGWYYVSDTAANQRKVAYVPVAQTAGSMKYVKYDTGIAHGDSTIDGWASKYTHAVVLYAAIKVVEAKIGDYAINEEDVELVQGITTLLASLRSQYDSYFETPKPQGAPA